MTYDRLWFAALFAPFWFVGCVSTPENIGRVSDASSPDDSQADDAVVSESFADVPDVYVGDTQIVDSATAVDTSPADTRVVPDAACPSPCGISPQCGCAGAACAYSGPTRGCLVAGTSGLNEKCSSTCKAGFQCVAGLGCMRFCSLAEPCTDLKGSAVCTEVGGVPGETP